MTWAEEERAKLPSTARDVVIEDAEAVSWTELNGNRYTRRKFNLRNMDLSDVVLASVPPETGEEASGDE